jgi:hypothetical protein
VEALRRARSKGGLDQRDVADTYLLEGAAQFSIDSETRAGRQRAREAFQNAARYSATRTSAQGWIQYIDAIQATLDAQDEVERLQRIEQRRRELERCETLIDLRDLGGQVNEEDVAECETLIARAETEDPDADPGADDEEGEEATDDAADPEEVVEEQAG